MKRRFMKILILITLAVNMSLSSIAPFQIGVFAGNEINEGEVAGSLKIKNSPPKKVPFFHGGADVYTLKLEGVPANKTATLTLKEGENIATVYQSGVVKAKGTAGGKVKIEATCDGMTAGCEFEIEYIDIGNILANFKNPDSARKIIMDAYNIAENTDYDYTVSSVSNIVEGAVFIVDHTIAENPFILSRMEDECAQYDDLNLLNEMDAVDEIDELERNVYDAVDGAKDYDLGQPVVDALNNVKNAIDIAKEDASRAPEVDVKVTYAAYLTAEAIFRKFGRQVEAQKAKELASSIKWAVEYFDYLDAVDEMDNT